MILEEKYGAENVARLLDKYKAYSDRTIFRFGQVIRNYREHAVHCNRNKVHFGFEKVDALVRGVQPSEVCYIIAPTNVGKTTVAMNLIRNNLNDETVIPYFGMENNEYQMFERMVQLETGLQFWEIQEKFIANDNQFIEQCEELAKKWESCITVVERISLDNLIPINRVIEEITGKRIKFIVIDYIQLVKHMIANEYTRISDIADTIKELSLSLRIPIFVMSQVNRSSTDNEVTLTSGKGSGSIENSGQLLFSLTDITEPVLSMNDPTLNAIIEANNEGFGKERPLLFRPHKLKRFNKEDVVLLMNRKSLAIREYSKPPIVPPDRPEDVQERLI